MLGQILGDYELQQEIGRGPSAVVYTARQHPVERYVAVKVFEPQSREVTARLKDLYALIEQLDRQAKTRSPSYIRIQEMKLRNLKGQTRRIFFNYLKKGYVAEQLEKRKGDCRQCRQCCALVFRCPFLNSDSKCIIYHKGRPRHCTTFPLDKNDLQDIEGECGYCFD